MRTICDCSVYIYGVGTSVESVDVCIFNEVHTLSRPRSW
jgi:hypothetical protein